MPNRSKPPLRKRDTRRSRENGCSPNERMHAAGFEWLPFSRPPCSVQYVGIGLGVVVGEGRRGRACYCGDAAGAIIHLVGLKRSAATRLSPIAFWWRDWGSLSWNGGGGKEAQPATSQQSENASLSLASFRPLRQKNFAFFGSWRHRKDARLSGCWHFIFRRVLFMSSLAPAPHPPPL